jgi:type IV pilus assembly protein PilQ
MNRTIGAIAVLLFSILPMLAQQADTLRQKEPELPKGATELTNISFKDTDVRDIFRALSFQHNLNVFVDNSINKRATISLNRVRVYDALKFICDQNSLVLNLDGGIFKVLPSAKAEPPPPKIPWIDYDRGLLSVKLKNDDLEQVVLRIQEKSGKNILLTSGTAGSLSGTLNDIEFDLGFTQVMNNNGFAVQKRSGIYIVSKLDYYVGQQPAQQQRAGPYWISVKDSLVTLDVINAPLDRVISDMTRQLNADVVFYSQVSGTVTARASNVSLSRAFDLILRNTNFGYRESEGIFFVGEKANKALLATRLIKLKYLRADKVMDLVPPSITTQSTMKVMKEHNGLVIIAPSDIISQAEEFLHQLDQPVAQVLIEAIVVDYDYSKGSELGVGAGYRGSGDSLPHGRTDVIIPGIDISFNGSQLNSALTGNIFGKDLGIANLGRLPSNFYLNLRALEQKGVANIKSRPLIATLNGSPASLSIGTTQYFILKTTTPYRDPTQIYLQESQNFQTIEADVKLEITPYVGSDGQITVDIKPDFRVPVGVLSPDIPPTINKRALSSTLVMREGETIVLGGLIQETETENRTQTPILGSIPVLGYLFSSTSKSSRKSELIIYVTPHISYGEAFQNVDLGGAQK